MTQTFVAIDIETTGLDPDRDGVTEVGAVRFTSDGGPFETFHSSKR
jgi:DNA polymerase III epsilon subunit-like protein